MDLMTEKVRHVSCLIVPSHGRAWPAEPPLPPLLPPSLRGIKTYKRTLKVYAALSEAWTVWPPQHLCFATQTPPFQSILRIQVAIHH